LSITLTYNKELYIETRRHILQFLIIVSVIIYI